MNTLVSNTPRQQNISWWDPFQQHTSKPQLCSSLLILPCICVGTPNQPCFLHHAWASLCASLQMQPVSRRHPGRSQDDRRRSGASVAPPPGGPISKRSPLLSEPQAGAAAPCPAPQPGSPPAVHTRQRRTLLTQQFINTVLRFNSIFLFHAFVVLPILTRKEIMANVFLKLLKVQYVSTLSRACIEITVLILGSQFIVLKRIY